MSTVELRFCRRPPQDLWLNPDIPEGADALVIGWLQDSPPVDSGVPPEVGGVIAKASTDSFRVTFVDPGSTKAGEWHESANRAVRFLHAEGFGRLNPSAGYALTSTLDSTEVARLFDTEESLWTLQTQIALLTDKSSPPPLLTFSTVDQLVRQRRLDPSALERESTFRGAIFPGPDGDFAQLIFLQNSLMERFVDALRAACQQSGLVVAEVSQAEFRHTKWFLEGVRP